MHCRSLLFTGSFVLLLAATPAGAQPASHPPGDDLEPGWHIVRPGDTLESLANRYLGSNQLWRRLAELNRDILNPNKIEPGQRVRVLVPVRGTLPLARVDRVSRKVEEQPHPNPWAEARPGDLLVERDAVRTYRASSAVMDFRDGTSLRITEDSLVFLNRASGRLQGTSTHAVEIVEGQADVELGQARAAGGSAPEAGRPEVEIVMGNTRAVSKPAASGTGQTRARKAEGGGAKVMVYGGEGAVEAGGATVQVAQGMGTSVEKEGPPGPPEKLLPAPSLSYPADGAVAVCASLRVTWQPVPESQSYTVEVCRDAQCAELVERTVSATGGEWRASVLPPGDYFWRVTARSRSGLDGYPSATSRVSVREGMADATAPAGSIKILGTTVRIDDKLYVPPTVALEVAAADGGSGLSGWQPRVDDKDSSLEAWTGVWPAGAHTAGAVALDLCGNRGPIAPVSFIVDSVPPVLAWTPAGPPQEQFRSRRGRRLRRGDPGDQVGFLWVPSDPYGRLRWDERWRTAPAGTVHQSVEIASDLPTFFIKMETARLLLDGKPLPADKGEKQEENKGIVRLDATDAGARVTKLILRTESTEAGPVLTIEAIDGVGNVATQELKIERVAAANPER